ncbi:MAG: ribonuclease HII [Oscillospiraceae bacterium]
MELYEFDRQAGGDGLLCGMDEAGRGPLAGDCYAAAVVFAPETVIAGVNDSKKLTAKKRERLFEEIVDKALACCIATATVAEIEEINILNAAMLAMERAFQGVAAQLAAKGMTVELALADGNKTPALDCTVSAVIGGDAKSQCIAAASILAKVARDRYMEELAEQYPQYLFEKHKGYGTKLHYEMLALHGASPVHRPSFLRSFYAKQNGAGAG